MKMTDNIAKGMLNLHCVPKTCDHIFDDKLK